MLPILQIGPLTLRTPGLALLGGLWFGLELASRAGTRRGISEDHIYNLGFFTLLAGVLGARLGFVLTHFKLYTGITPPGRALLSVFALSTGTETLWAGLLAASAVAVYLVHRWKLPVSALLDSYAPGIALFVIALGIANLFSGDWYGVETRLPWAITLWGASRHPTQIYLALAGLLTLGLLLRREHRVFADHMPGKRGSKAKAQVRTAQAPPQPGVSILTLSLMLSLTLLLIEPLRADSPVIFGNIRTWQVAALGTLVATLLAHSMKAPLQLTDADQPM